ncbi:DUF3023 domain-containing protein [Ehrlichia muris]|uniref:Uncharacterized protein n=1 Tax=Ehrlichia muris AS145 TaxID=1423892 RepID=V9RA91_9RICK|nr:DUF3023 domain-containing protein [Ehrlichia muris]AHC39704.1 hypothetical protein EMUR_01880 [Ehrlichia muris AS145]
MLDYRDLQCRREHNRQLCNAVASLPELHIERCYLIGGTRLDNIFQVRVTKHHRHKKPLTVVNEGLVSAGGDGLPTVVHGDEIPGILHPTNGQTLWLVKCKLSREVLQQNTILRDLVGAAMLLPNLKLALYCLVDPGCYPDFLKYVRSQVGYFRSATVSNFFSFVKLIYVRVRGVGYDQGFSEAEALESVAQLTAIYFIENLVATTDATSPHDLVCLREQNSTLCKELKQLPHLLVKSCHLIGGTRVDGTLQVNIARRNDRCLVKIGDGAIVANDLSQEQIMGISPVAECQIPSILHPTKGQTFWVVTCKLPRNVLQQNTALKNTLEFKSVDLFNPSVTLYCLVNPTHYSKFLECVCKKTKRFYSTSIPNFFDSASLVYVRVHRIDAATKFNDVFALQDVAQLSADFFVESSRGLLGSRKWTLVRSRSSGDNMPLGAVGEVSESEDLPLGAVGGVSESEDLPLGAVGGVSESEDLPLGAVGGVSESEDLPLGAVGGVSVRSTVRCRERMRLVIEERTGRRQTEIVRTRLQNLSICLEHAIRRDEYSGLSK